MGMLADLTARAEAELNLVRGRLADGAHDDDHRPALEEHRAELELLLHDLAHELTSPTVLRAAATLRAEIRSSRRDADSIAFRSSLANAS
jgi:hypothetical protein